MSQNSDIDYEDDYSPDKSFDIGKLCDIKEMSPTKNQLETYIGQKIAVIGFEDTTPKIFKKKDRQTIILRFYDEKKILREIMTSSKYLVEMCHHLRKSVGFGTPQQKIKAATGYLLATGRGRAFRSVYLGSEEDVKDSLQKIKYMKKHFNPEDAEDETEE